MPRRALKICSCIRCDGHPGSCPEIVAAGRCPRCTRTADAKRVQARDGAYSTARWAGQRRLCLERDPLCTCDGEHCTTRTADGRTVPLHEPGRCLTASTVADHDPVERKDLVASGDPDPDALRHLRGKCSGCHNRRTGRTSPGGWNAR